MRVEILPMLLAKFELNSNQEVESVCAAVCCLRWCCLVARQSLPHPPQRRCSCSDNLGVLIAVISLLVSPLSAMTTIAIEFRAALLLTFSLSLACVIDLFPLDVFAHHALVHVLRVDFHWCFSH